MDAGLIFVFAPFCARISPLLTLISTALLLTISSPSCLVASVSLAEYSFFGAESAVSPFFSSLMVPTAAPPVAASSFSASEMPVFSVFPIFSAFPASFVFSVTSVSFGFFDVNPFTTFTPAKRITKTSTAPTASGASLLICFRRLRCLSFSSRICRIRCARRALISSSLFVNCSFT